MTFVITLCAVFTIQQWRQLLVLITAFTIGHSVTLALAALKVIHINSQLVEILIPITILCTSIYNIIPKKGSSQSIKINYMLAMFFGLIHGMGFSNFFSAMMASISDASIVFPLFSFNLGIEIGQLMIVSCIVVAMLIVISLFRVDHRHWNLYVSGAGGGIAVTMIINALFV